MAGKKEFRITTPRGSVFTVTGKTAGMGSGIRTEKSGGIFKGAGICGFRVPTLHESIDTEKNRDAD